MPRLFREDQRQHEAGEEEKLWVMSPSPMTLSGRICTTSVKGAIVRTMRFQSSVSLIGITGRKLGFGPKSACQRTVRSLPLLKIWRAGRRFDARDPIEVCDQARQQGDEQSGLLVREVAQHLMIAPK
jgi:hypothetical protein